jgi:hypothetical protein
MVSNCHIWMQFLGNHWLCCPTSRPVRSPNSLVVEEFSSAPTNFAVSIISSNNSHFGIHPLGEGNMPTTPYNTKMKVQVFSKGTTLEQRRWHGGSGVWRPQTFPSFNFATVTKRQGLSDMHHSDTLTMVLMYMILTTAVKVNDRHNTVVNGAWCTILG